MQLDYTTPPRYTDQVSSPRAGNTLPEKVYTTLPLQAIYKLQLTPNSVQYLHKKLDIIKPDILGMGSTERGIPITCTPTGN